MSNWPTDRDAAKPLPDIPGYRLSHVIGHGGMSTVYLGTQLSLGREVAIKVMLPDALADEVSRRRFENEARTIARLEHPHIVGIHEVGRTRDGLPWYSMPHLPRGHAGQRDFRGDEARVREILQALLSALAFAHARGVIHRDVKAENVLFDEANRPLLADFGIALRRGHGTRVTMTGLAVGSTAYMAPEQARGQQVDHRADLYSVGVLAWEMLTGSLPYQANDALAMAIQHAQNPLPKLPPQLRHWQRFMDKAMAKSPRKRFHDAQQMSRALDALPLRPQVDAGAIAALWQRGVAALRRMPRVAWVGVVLLAAAATGLLLHPARLADERVAGPAPAATTSPVAPGGASSAMPSPAGLPATAAAARADAAAMANGETADGPLPPGGAASSAEAVALDPASAMHRAAPQSDTERLLLRMQRQIARGQLASPGDDHALASLRAARRADPEHLQLPAATEALFNVLGGATAAAIGNGRAGEGDLLLRAANSLARDEGASAEAPQERYRDTVAKALLARAQQAAVRVDREASAHLVAQARLAGLPTATVERLAGQAARIPARGGQGGKLDGLVLVEDGSHAFAAFRTPVSRAEYARFAASVGRPPALCRERASLLRVLAPRDWNEPGFEQSGADPVVCVSWQDAQAYAKWLGEREGLRYRLATAAEAARLPAPAGERVVGEWREDCAADCNRRSATGVSWRSRNASRTLDPTRGYDDIGFRLVRDL